MINSAFLFPLIIIGFLACYFDFKKGIIPNKLILSGFIWGFFLYSFLFFYNIFFLESPELFDYLPTAFSNGVISVFLGYLIWMLGFWSAGDGKLFGLYGFLLPLEFYSGYYINHFPAFALLANFAVPLIFLLFFKATITAIKKNEEIFEKIKKKEFLQMVNLKRYGKSAFIFTTDIAMAMIIISFLVIFFERFLLIPPNGFIIFILLVILMYIFRRLKSKFPLFEFAKYLIIFTFFGNLLAQGDFGTAVGFLRTIIVFALFIGLLKWVLLFYVQREETDKIPAKEVEEGMMLTKEWEQYLSSKISKFKKPDKRQHFKNIRGGGLTRRQAEIIRELFDDDERYMVEICNTLPFAPFMFIAAMISIITQSSFIPPLIDFFNLLTHF